MSGVAAAMGIETVHTVTDDVAPVTREQVLEGLREMVTQAQPGDSLLFSFLGRGGQTSDVNGDEGNGYDEFIQCSDGPITDDEIRAILADVPEGATMTMVCDSSASGTIADIDFSDMEIPGNVVVLSACTSTELAASGINGSPFTNAVAEVMTNNPGVTWAEAAELIDAADGTSSQLANLAANRPELLYEPAFAPTSDAAHDHHAHEQHAEDRDGDGYQERVVETYEDGTVVERVDTDGDGVVEMTATHYTDGTTILEDDLNGDGLADSVATFAADGSVTFLSTDAPAYQDGAAAGDGYHETRIEINPDGTQSIRVDYDGDGVFETNADADYDGRVDGDMDVNQDGHTDLTHNLNLVDETIALAGIADIDIGGGDAMCC
ncbi:Ca(2+)-dependent cysteine protease [Blastocladiella emersonii ATCC 22665]|nr:Ca(2+)-dependent cysteine protease [Blastocladiella emersonii ATCC 22665]